MGKTKRGKGTKIMAVADGGGLPVAVHVASASPHEVTLVEATLERTWTGNLPGRLIGDKAYDSDQLDSRLFDQRGVELIAPHRSNRHRTAPQDGRTLQRYKKRWIVERSIAWLNRCRRLSKDWECLSRNALAFLRWASVRLMLRRLCHT